MCINCCRGRLFRNFLTNFGSSIVSPRAADFDAISASFPPKSSMVSVFFILRRLNSDIKVCSLASFNLYAPTFLVLMASHTFLAVFSSPTCRTIASGMDDVESGFTKLLDLCKCTDRGSMGIEHKDWLLSTL
ncbi:unnamed protein product [Microthlaspi erraticum]|uniref:Uncharacterized protein n=1 Tax=Microthlaspi erraticum TaxID=1685480 RepID=A0A6D2KGV4_9BRAS|nr:unnamed protein product [Microthlaspi erraticum]